MKKRFGFVSNSSSSSFVLGKVHMTEDQIEKFQHNLNEINEANSDEGYIFETKYYFHGEVSNHNRLISELINELDLNEFVSFEC